MAWANHGLQLPSWGGEVSRSRELVRFASLDCDVGSRSGISATLQRGLEPFDIVKENYLHRSSPVKWKEIRVGRRLYSDGSLLGKPSDRRLKENAPPVRQIW
jgi:hypothetical protein